MTSLIKKTKDKNALIESLKEKCYHFLTSIENKRKEITQEIKENDLEIAKNTDMRQIRKYSRLIAKKERLEKELATLDRSACLSNFNVMAGEYLEAEGVCSKNDVNDVLNAVHCSKRKTDATVELDGTKPKRRKGCRSSKKTTVSEPEQAENAMTLACEEDDSETLDCNRVESEDPFLKEKLKSAMSDGVGAKRTRDTSSAVKMAKEPAPRSSVVGLSDYVLESPLYTERFMCPSCTKKPLQYQESEGKLMCIDGCGYFELYTNPISESSSVVAQYQKQVISDPISSLGLNLSSFSTSSVSSASVTARMKYCGTFAVMEPCSTPSETQSENAVVSSQSRPPQQYQSNFLAFDGFYFSRVPKDLYKSLMKHREISVLREPQCCVVPQSKDSKYDNQSKHKLKQFYANRFQIVSRINSFYFPQMPLQVKKTLLSTLNSDQCLLGIGRRDPQTVIRLLLSSMNMPPAYARSQSMVKKTYRWNSNVNWHLNLKSRASDLLVCAKEGLEYSLSKL